MHLQYIDELWLYHKGIVIGMPIAVVRCDAGCRHVVGPDSDDISTFVFALSIDGPLNRGQCVPSRTASHPRGNPEQYVTKMI